MNGDLFFKGEIPALETDKEGKLRGGFCAFSGGEAGFFTDAGDCSNSDCGNSECINTCGKGTGTSNGGCINTCDPDNKDLNSGCSNTCPINSGCSTTNDCKCTTTPDKERQGTGFSVFSLGASALF